MGLIEGCTGVRFVKRTAVHAGQSFLYVKRGIAGLSSTVGCHRFKPNCMTLNPDCKNFQLPYSIVHELMHVLGFCHMHQNEQRATHLRVISDNIQPDRLRNFVIASSETFGLRYDINSILHYGPCAFARVPCPNKECCTGCTLKPLYVKDREALKKR